MPSERTVRCRQWGPVPGDGAMSRWNGFRRNTMLGFHSRKSIVFDCGALGVPQSRRPGCNAASAAAPKTRREELSRIASVNLKKASSGCRSAVSSRVLAFCVMVVCLVATLGVTAANLRLTYVTDSNGAKQVILTSATDPAKVMSLSGIQSEEGDQVYYTAFSGNLATLNIERAFSVNIQADGQTYPVKMVYGTVADALQRAGITLEGDDYTEPALDRLVTAGTQIVVHRVDYQDRVETQAIPYDTEYVYTSLYFRNTGRTTTVQHGAEGQQTVTTRDRYVDGELENSIVVDSTTTVQPTNHVIKTYGAGAPVSPLTGPDGNASFNAHTDNRCRYRHSRYDEYFYRYCYSYLLGTAICCYQQDKRLLQEKGVGSACTVVAQA